MLKINKVSDFRVYKIKGEWAVYFKVKDKNYMLHEYSESYGVGSITLFEKVSYQYGNKNLIHIKTERGTLSDYLIDCYLNGGFTYSQFNKELFIARLVERGFVECNDKFVQYIVKQNENNRKLKKMIRQLEREINING